MFWNKQSLPELPLPQLKQDPPYVLSKKEVKRWINHRETEYDRQLYDQCINYVVKWCVEKSILKTNDSDNSLILNLQKYQDDLCNVIYETNMRSLCETSNLNIFMDRIKDNSLILTTTELQQLSINLNIVFGEHVIDPIINRIYRGYHAIPNPNADLTWTQVHISYPFLWIVFLIQVVMRFYAKQIEKISI